MDIKRCVSVNYAWGQHRVGHALSLDCFVIPQCLRKPDSENRIKMVLLTLDLRSSV